jgi:hypothetical protein
LDFALVVVQNEAHFPEFVHEIVYPGTRCTNHLRQRLLGNVRKHRLCLARRAVTCQQQQSACQPFLAGIKELVHQILFDSKVS